MKPTANNKIVFANHNQVTLYECELKGQISDGFWENATPFVHWHCMCDATASWNEDPNFRGCNFYPRRRYNFGNKELIDIVGERMINFVKFYAVYPDISYDYHWDFESLMDYDRITCTGNYMINDYISEKGSSYEKGQIEHAMKLFNISDVQVLREKIDAAIAYDYTMANLRADLREMSEIVNSGTRIDYLTVTIVEPEVNALSDYTAQS